MIEHITANAFQPRDYVGAVRNYRSLMKELFEVAEPDQEHVHRLATAIEHTGAAHASLMTEDWCGDSACNVPILAKLFEPAGLPFRIVRGSEVPQVKEFYENDGTDHIPVVSVWDNNEHELMRWVEAPQRVTEQKEAWKREHPHFEKLYEKQRSGDSGAMKEFAKLYRHFLEEMAGWYRDGMWNETTREVVEMLEQAAR